nr:BTB/POZ domain-containing protein At2g30600 [Ipomoea batatas]
MIDLGYDHQLMCNYYTIRQDGSRAFMRSWNFQGIYRRCELDELESAQG